MRLLDRLVRGDHFIGGTLRVGVLTAILHYHIELYITLTIESDNLVTKNDIKPINNMDWLFVKKKGKKSVRNEKVVRDRTS